MSSDLSIASADRGIRVLTVYGGVPYEPQLEGLTNGVDIVVGTPGRLIDLMNRKALDISHVKSLVLDEADEMLDLGFLPDVERLIAGTPETRQTMLFSATMPAAIVALARMHMRHPMNIRAESSYENATVPATAQFIYQAHDLDKPEMIGRLLQAEGSGLTIIFTRTKRQAQRVADDLVERGFKASPLHGDMAQAAREKALTRFREGKIQVLVATDVAARGIDVQDVTHVINYTCPEDDKTYVHRIGRTGRAGATGIAVTFVDWSDLHRWKMINKALDLPFDEPVETYSSSEHFFHDMGIPHGTKGRLIPEGEVVIPRQPRKDGGKGGGKGGRGARSGGRGEGRDGGSRGGRGRPESRSESRSESTPASSTRRQARPHPQPQPSSHPWRRPVHREARGRVVGAQATTTTSVPTSAKSHIRIASASFWRMQPCDCGVPSWASVCSGTPFFVGMLWNPIAALGPCANRTKYCITPESSIPTAHRDREYTSYLPGARLSVTLPDTR